jgi:hypothetical protein
VLIKADEGSIPLLDLPIAGNRQENVLAGGGVPVPALIIAKSLLHSVAKVVL